MWTRSYNCKRELMVTEKAYCCYYVLIPSKHRYYFIILIPKSSPDPFPLRTCFPYSWISNLPVLCLPPPLESGIQFNWGLFCWKMEYILIACVLLENGIQFTYIGFYWKMDTRLYVLIADKSWINTNKCNTRNSGKYI